MAKTVTVLDLVSNGKQYSVVYHVDEKVNPYWLYEHTATIGEYGYLQKHRRLLAKYQTMYSCLCYLSMDPAFRLEN
jgi:hypothetical protein